MKSFILFIFFLFLTISYQKTTEEWKSRAIYQVLTDRFYIGDGSEPLCDIKKNQYCGGNFQGIVKKLDYIKNLGFDSIWISPVNENVDSPNNYHGYADKNKNKINPHFGTSQELKDLVKAAHAKGMWVMVDVVANHMGCLGGQFGTQTYDQYVPFNKEQYYHEKCDIDFTDDMKNFQECRLACLIDLNQDDPFVEAELLKWIKNLVTDYSFDGIRIDTVGEVPKAFWKKFIKAAGVYSVGEAYDSRMFFVSGFQGFIDGMLNYPVYFYQRWAFGKDNKMIPNDKYKNAQKLEELNGLMYSFIDQAANGVFVDNHDNSRFLSYQKDETLFLNYLTYSLTSIGIPIMYYGTEQGFTGGDDPFCRENMWGHFDETHKYFKYTQKIMYARKYLKLWEQKQIQSYAADHFYAFTRGKSLFLFSSSGSNGVEIKGDISYPQIRKSGDKLCNIFKPTDCITANSSGVLKVSLQHGETKVYIEEAAMKELIKQYPTIFN